MFMPFNMLIRKIFFSLTLPPPPPKRLPLLAVTMLKFCIAIALSLCVVGVAYGQTQTPADPPVCSRTANVSDLIVERLEVAGEIHFTDDCTAVTAEHLATLEEFDLSGAALTSLAVDDFNDMSGLMFLYLENNQLQTLPLGIFAPTPMLQELELYGNNITRLPFGVFDGLSLTSFDTEGEIIVMGGALSTVTLTTLTLEGQSTVIDLEPAFVYGVGAGGIQPAASYEITVADENVLTVVRTAATHIVTISGIFNGDGSSGVTEVIITGRSPSFDPGSPGEGYEQEYRLAIAVEDPELPNLSVCDRTDEVETAILALLPSISNCNAVTVADLAGITGTFDLSNASISTLRSTDFSGLSGVTGLNLSGNAGLTTLPLGIFDGMPGLTTLILRNQGEQSIRRLPYGIFDNVDITNAADVGLIAIDGGLPSFITISLADNPSVELDLEPAFRIGFSGGLGAAENYHFTNDGDSIDIGSIASGSIDDDAHALTITGLAVGTGQMEVRAGGGSEPILSHTITINVLAGLPVCERTRQVRDEIVSRVRMVAGDGSIACSDITDEQLASITQIGLAFEGLESLNPSDFYGLSGVTRLEIGDNDLTELPPNIFSEMASLTTLNVGLNDIENLPETLFANNTGLRSVDLEFNDLLTLPVNLFNGLGLLKTLNLEGNDFIDLPAGIFDDLVSLEELDLASNEIRGLPETLFAANTNLKAVDLESNRLSALPVNLFEGLRLLEELDLSNNRLIDFGLPVGIFNDSDSLDVLDLFNNERLERLDDGVFDGLSLSRFDTRGQGTIAMVGALPSRIVLPADGSSMALDLEPAFVRGEFRGGIQPASSYTVTVVDKTIVEAEVSAADHTTTITALVDSGETRVYIATPPKTTLLALIAEVGAPEPDLPNPSVCARTEEVETAILALLPSVSDCSAVTVADLAGITGIIDLSAQGIASLSADDFNGLIRVTGLHLNDNRLTVLPLGIFDEMERLAELNLSGNAIDRLPFGIFNRRLLTAFNISGTVAMDGVLPSAAIALDNSDQSRTINLSSAFIRGTGGVIQSADPDDYDISVDDANVAEAGRDDHRITITAINTGMTEVVISIGDVNREHRIMVDSEWSPVSITVNPTSVSVAEGGTVNVAVSMDGEIEATIDVEYEMELTGPNEVTVSTDREVTLSITADNPAGYQGDRDRTVTLSAPGYISTDVTVRLLEDDLDGLDITLDSNSVVIESGDTLDLDVTIVRAAGSRDVNVTAMPFNMDVAAVGAVSETMLSLRAVNLGSTSVTLTAVGKGYTTATATLDVEVIRQLPDIIVKDPESDTAIDEIALAAGEAITLSVSLSEIDAGSSTEVTISTMPDVDYITLSHTTLSFSSTDPQELTVSVSPDASPGDETDLVFEAEGYTSYRIPLEVRVNQLIFRIKVFLEGAQ